MGFFLVAGFLVRVGTLVITLLGSGLLAKVAKREHVRDCRPAAMRGGGYSAVGRAA